MGQYHILVNLDKHEFVHPHYIGDGLKLWEWSEYGMLRAMQALVAVSNGRGGGDLPDDVDAGKGKKIVGRWGGDRIAIVGDYAESGDIKGKPRVNAKTIYGLCSAVSFPPDKDTKRVKGNDWKDITPLVAPYLEECGEFKFLNDGFGWRQRKFREEEVPQKPKTCIDMVISSNGVQSNVKG